MHAVVLEGHGHSDIVGRQRCRFVRRRLYAKVGVVVGVEVRWAVHRGNATHDASLERVVYPEGGPRGEEGHFEHAAEARVVLFEYSHGQAATARRQPATAPHVAVQHIGCAIIDDQEVVVAVAVHVRGNK